MEMQRHYSKAPIAEAIIDRGDEVDDYRSVPLEKAFTVRVKYCYRGEMKPRQVTLDE